MTGDCRKYFTFGQRHILVLLVHCGLAITHCLRVNLSVALVAMVNQTQYASINETNECPNELTNASVNQPTENGEFNWSRDLQGYILSSFYWGYTIFQLPAGIVARRFGAKWLFGLGTGITAVLTLLTPLVARLSVYLFIVLRFFEGVAEGVTNPAILVIMGRWLPREESSFLFSLAHIGGSTGTIIGQLTSGPLCASQFLGGWPAVFYINGAVALVWLLPWCLFVSDFPEAHPGITEEEKNKIMQSVGTSLDNANERMVPWIRIVLSRYVWVYAFTCVMSEWISNSIMTTLPQYLSDILHYNIKDDGIITSFPHIGYMISASIFSYVSDGIVRRRCIEKTESKKMFTLVAFLGCGASFFGITFIRCDKTLVVVLLIVAYSIYGIKNAGYMTNPFDLSTEYCGIIYGLSNTFARLITLATPVITDTITDQGTLSEWNIVFYISCAVAAVGGFTYFLFGSSERQSWDGASTNNSVSQVNKEKEDDTAQLMINVKDNDELMN